MPLLVYKCANVLFNSAYGWLRSSRRSATQAPQPTINPDDCVVLDTLLCESNGHIYDTCPIDYGQTITSVEVATRHSSASCNYNSGAPGSYTGSDGAYGYTNTVVWVDNGCRATFTICSGTYIYSGPRLCCSYNMACPPVRGDNPRALASGLSCVQVDKHGITILYHHQCRPCIFFKPILLLLS